MLADHGIHLIVKLKVDEYIQDSKSNFKIKEKLESEGFAEEVIPNSKQITNRRHYLRKITLKEMSLNTKGGFYKWLKEHTVSSFN